MGHRPPRDVHEHVRRNAKAEATIPAVEPPQSEGRQQHSQRGEINAARKAVRDNEQQRAGQIRRPRGPKSAKQPLLHASSEKGLLDHRRDQQQDDDGRAVLNRACDRNGGCGGDRQEQGRPPPEQILGPLTEAVRSR